jgi:MFS family permease
MKTKKVDIALVSHHCRCGIGAQKKKKKKKKKLTTFIIFSLPTSRCACSSSDDDAPVLTFGSYWVFDTPGAIFTQLQTWFAEDGYVYTNEKNLLLYSIYSWPNTVLALAGGFIVDRLTGIRLGAVIFAGLIAAGQVVFCLGIVQRLYWLCVLGRFIFGLGGESLTVAQNAYVCRWFSGDILAFAFGLVVSFARVGSSVNFVVTPRFAAIGVPFSVWFGAGACGFSLIVCLIAAALDKYGESRAKVSLSTEIVTLKHITRIPLPAWLLYLTCAFFYVAVLTFYAVASKIMQETGHRYSPETATLFISIPNFVSVIASPMFGMVVDRKGRALYLVLVAAIMLVIGHIGFLANAMEWIEIHPTILMTWVGLGYSLGAASLWPILSLVVEDNVLGTAYGLMTAIQNIGLAIFPQAIGALQDKKGIAGTRLEYTLPIMIFIACAGIAFFLCLILLGVDRRSYEGRMNASSAERDALAKEHADEKERAEDEGYLPPSVRGPSGAAPYVYSTEVVSPKVAIRAPSAIRSNYLSRLGIYRPAFV